MAIHLSAQKTDTCLERSSISLLKAQEMSKTTQSTASKNVKFLVYITLPLQNLCLLRQLHVRRIVRIEEKLRPILRFNHNFIRKVNCLKIIRAKTMTK
jgi:hypothetical protein